MFEVEGMFHWQLEEHGDGERDFRTADVRTDEKKSGIHDSGAVQHGGHENIVSRTVDERDVSNQTELAAAIGAIAWEHVFIVRAGRTETIGSWTFLVVAFENLSEIERGIRVRVESSNRPWHWRNLV